MQYRKIVIAGGSGYLGQVLKEYYAPKAQEVILLSRHAAPGATLWDASTEGPWTSSLEHADLLINCCGKNVNCRYTKKNRQAILRSRTKPTALLGRVIHKLAHPPKLWINITSATIYRHAEDRPQDETTGELGKGFSVDICKRWERVFFAAADPRTRQVALRMGIVFGKNDGVYPRLHNLVKAGLGGPQVNGRQMVSWIHEEDAARVTEWLLNHPQENGVVNCTAPYAVTNAEQMRILRKNKPGLPMPTWLLKLGAIIIGTETELILKSRWVQPKRLEDKGFTWLYPTLGEAVSAIVLS